METKPYSLQSPEAIAKEYSGNKMKIAQAAQLGLLDPTAAVLAGMFIDRMRGAQQQEQAPQRTVAQQVLAPTPQAPAGAGLGATPQAAQLAAAYPQEGAPPPIPGPTIPTQEPVMAADGGLMSLPVDDAMFEPAYKEGGIVAFAAGSQEPIQEGGRGGFLGLQIPDTVQANRADAFYPTPKIANAQVADAAIAADPQAAEAATKKGGASGLEAYIQQYKQLMSGISEGEGVKEYKEYLKNLPGELDKRKEEDLWSALAQFGFNLASSQSPYFLQAAGQAGAQAMPAITGALKERRSAKDEARKARAELDKMTRAEEMKAVEGGIKLYGDEQVRETQMQVARAAADKPTDMRSYVSDYVSSARAAGDNQTPDAVLRQRGAENYLTLYGAAGSRATAALSQAATAAAQAETSIQDRARDNVDNSLAKNWNSPENREIRRLQKEDRKNKTNEAEAYVQRLYSVEEERIRGSQPTSPSSAAPTPVLRQGTSTPILPPIPVLRQGTPIPIPQPAIDMLKKNPTPQTKKQFDQVFGVGAADRTLGK